MKKIIFFLDSSVGKKIVMAITGFSLIGFLMVHLLGNFLLFVGAKQFNAYSHALVSNPLIYIAEVGLISLFIFHTINALRVTWQASKARPVKYVKRKTFGKATIASSNMGISGVTFLLFVILHVWLFKYGKDINPAIDGVKDIYAIVVAAFQNRLFSLFSIIALSLVGFHLSHGARSLLQTFGLYDNRFTPIIDKGAILFGAIMAIAFCSVPVYFGFLKSGGM